MNPSEIGHDCLSVDFEDKDLQKSDRELFIGFAAMQAIHKNDLEGINAVAKFCSDVRGFHTRSLTYIKSKFPLTDLLIKNAALIDPLERTMVSLESLINLVSTIPDNIVPHENRESLSPSFASTSLLTSLPSLPMRSVISWTHFGFLCRNWLTQPRISRYFQTLRNWLYMLYSFLTAIASVRHCLVW